MPDINDQYERKHLANIARTNERIREVFSEAIHTLSLSAGRIRFNGEVFDLSKYPALKAQIEEVIKEMQASIYTAIVNSIEASWGLSNEKNDILVDRRLAGRKPAKDAAQVLYDSNKGALDAFVKRKERGLNLSDRVWNSLDPFKTELEKGLGLGISEGKPAREMAKELKQFLNEPDKLFRRVRDAKGKLKLSKAAQDYHPGQGVYRSSYKNALRLSRTETQLSYQNADHERWSTLPFIKGIEVRLSNRHPEYDVCDEVKGLKPPDYKFIARHPNCLCHAVPVFVSDEDYEKIEDAILEGKEPPPVSKITDIPEAEKQWVRDNAERIKGWKNEPYFITQNQKYLSEDALSGKASVVEMSESKGFTSAKSIKEAEEWAVSRGYANKVDYSNATLEQVNELNQTLAEIHRGVPVDEIRFKQDDFEWARGEYRAEENSITLSNLLKTGDRSSVLPGTERMQRKVKELEAQGSLSEYEEELLSSYRERIKNATRTGATNGSIRDTLIHEYGHKIDYQNKLSTFIDVDGTPVVIESATEKAAKELAERIGRGEAAKEWISKNISDYAATNLKEFFAEAYTMKVKGEKIPSWLNEYITKVMNNAR